MHAQKLHIEPDPNVLLLRAIEALGGAVLVLDRNLRIVASTPSAARTLGAPVAVGTHVVKILGEGASAGPIAQALADGRAAAFRVPLAGGQALRVRTALLRERGRHVGWIVRVSDEARLDAAVQRLGAMRSCDPEMKRVLALAASLADESVVIEGEAGTGKATLASAIHERSARREQPLRTLSAALVTPELFEHQARQSCTLILDDADELPIETQGYLLRALESGVVTPADGGAPFAIDVRAIAITRADLDREVERGRFRADLLYRLRTVRLRLPPLRDRAGDVALLASELAEITDEVRAALEAYAWPGNVRELRSAIESALARRKGPRIELDDLPPPLGIEATSVAAPQSEERARVEAALARAAGDRTRAAAMLGISRSTLWRRMRALGLR